MIQRFTSLALAILGVAIPGVTLCLGADAIESEPSLAAYWKLDDFGVSSVTDASGNGHTGAISGLVGLGEPSAMPTLGHAAVFEATSGMVNVPYSAALNPATFTIETWAQVDQRTYYHAPLMSRGGSGGSESGYNFYAANDNLWHFWTGNGPANPGTWDVSYGPSVVSGQWVHLAGTYDGTTKNFYMNGTLVDSDVVGFGQNTGTNLRISPAGSVAFDGRIDNVAVLSQGLDAERIQAHYNSFSPYATDVLGSNPVGYWRLGEQAGTTGYDAAGTRDGAYSNVAVRQIADTALTADIDTAAGFNGSSSKLSVPYDAALNPASFSIEAWAKAEGGAGSYRSVITSRSGGGGTQGYIIYASADNEWEFWTGSGTGGWDTLDGPAVTLGDWVHLVATYDAGTSQKTLYVNGQTTGPVAGAYAPLTVASNPLTIGSGNDTGTSYFFNGKLDEVAVYDSVLSPFTVEQRYNLGISGGVPSPEPGIRPTSYTYSTAPNAHADYYVDEFKMAGSPGGDLTNGVILPTSGGPAPDDTLVGWTSATSTDITYDLGGRYALDEIKIGYSVYVPSANGAPDDVQVAFSTDGVNFSAPVTYSGFTGMAFHNDLTLTGLAGREATHVRLSFDGGSQQGSKYLLDETQFDGTQGPFKQKLPVASYSFSAAPNAHGDYYQDETGSDLTGGPFIGVGGSPEPDDGTVGWNANTPVDITFDLGANRLIQEMLIGYSVYLPFSNDAPDDVAVSFSTDGLNYSAPLVFDGFTGTEFRNNLWLDIPDVFAQYVKLAFDGGTANGAGKYLLDEVAFLYVPEPSGLVLLGLGLLGLGLIGRRKR